MDHISQSAEQAKEETRPLASEEAISPAVEEDTTQAAGENDTIDELEDLEFLLEEIENKIAPLA